MAKDKSLSKEERKAAKAAAASATVAGNGVSSDSGVTKSKSDKKEKKEKKEKKAKALELALAAQEDSVAVADGHAKKNKEKKVKEAVKAVVGDDGEVKSDEEEDEVMEGNEDAVKTVAGGRPVGALVPFANPLADEKTGKKVFKSVKKAAASRALKRGVKEVVKALRKSPSSLPPNSTSTSSTTLPLGVVILAADISPMDVISHIPVLCEDHNVPYIYVTSRAELGMAGQTKRPTSVVMVAKDAGKKKDKDGDKKKKSGAEDGDDKEDWSETYKSLVKVVEKEGKRVKF